MENNKALRHLADSFRDMFEKLNYDCDFDQEEYFRIRSVDGKTFKVHSFMLRNTR